MIRKLILRELKQLAREIPDKAAGWLSDRGYPRRNSCEGKCPLCCDKGHR